MAIVQDELYIMGGYGKAKDYAGDAWKLRVSDLLCRVPAVCSMSLLKPCISLKVWRYRSGTSTLQFVTL